MAPQSSRKRVRPQCTAREIAEPSQPFWQCASQATHALPGSMDIGASDAQPAGSRVARLPRSLDPPPGWASPSGACSRCARPGCHPPGGTASRYRTRGVLPLAKARGPGASQLSHAGRAPARQHSRTRSLSPDPRHAWRQSCVWRRQFGGATPGKYLGSDAAGNQDISGAGWPPWRSGRPWALAPGAAGVCGRPCGPGR